MIYHKTSFFIMLFLLFLNFIPVINASISSIKIDNSNFIFSNDNILYVGGSGPNNYTKIMDAVNNASDGDTVFVYDDFSPYIESVKIDKSIQLIGENKTTTIIDSPGQITIWNEDSGNILIKGFTLLNHCSSTDETYGVDLSSAKNITLTENIIIGSHWGVKWSETSNCSITNNEIRDGFIGIYIYRVSSGTISGNQFTDNNYGIQFYGAGNSIISDNKFTNNGLYLIHKEEDVIILNNTVNDKELLYLENEHDLIFDNVSIGQLFLIDCKNITMKNLEISNASIGIENLDSDNCLITKSKIHSNLGAGIMFVDTCKDIIISHCDIRNNSNGIYTRNGHLSESQITDNTLRFNGIGMDISIDVSTVSDNIVENCNEGMDILCYVSTISDNIVKNCNLGMDISSHVSKVSDNIVENCSNRGMNIQCSTTTVRDNIVKNCNEGLVLEIGLLSVLTNNQIIHNNIGLSLYFAVFSCIIHSNNFIDNQKHADFVFFRINGGRFLNNYWDDLSSSGLKVIFGNRYIFSGFDYYGDPRFDSLIPWVKFDWNPASEPYDIEV